MNFHLYTICLWLVSVFISETGSIIFLLLVSSYGRTLRICLTGVCYLIINCSYLCSTITFWSCNSKGGWLCPSHGLTCSWPWNMRSGLRPYDNRYSFCTEIKLPISSVTQFWYLLVGIKLTAIPLLSNKLHREHHISCCFVREEIGLDPVCVCLTAW